LKDTQKVYAMLTSLAAIRCIFFFS